MSLTENCVVVVTGHRASSPGDAGNPPVSPLNLIIYLGIHLNLLKIKA